MKPYWMCTLIAVSLLSLSCGKEDVVATAGGQILSITNQSNETLHYVAFPSNLLSVMNVTPTCTDQNAINPGETKTISYEEFLQTGPDEEAMIYWWRCDEGKTQTPIAKAKLVRLSL